MCLGKVVLHRGHHETTEVEAPSITMARAHGRARERVCDREGEREREREREDAEQ